MFHSRLVDHPDVPNRKAIPASGSPDEAQRHALEARRRELRASLRPTPGTDVRNVVLAVLAIGRQYGATTPQQAAVTLALYIEAVAELPTWALDKARRTFAKGGWKCAWNGRGTPSSADLVEEARGHLTPIWVELRRIEAVLAAVPIATPNSEELAAAVAERRRFIEAFQDEERRREAESRTIVAADLESRRLRRESGAPHGAARCF
jgi:hypothetical protein